MELLALILILAMAFVWILESLFVITVGILMIVALIVSEIWNEFKKICHILYSSRHYKGKDRKAKDDRSSDDM